MIEQREELYYVKGQRAGQYVFDPPHTNEVSEHNANIYGGLKFEIS